MRAGLRSIPYVLAVTGAYLFLVAVTAPGAAAQSIEDLARRVDAMESELQALKDELTRAKQEAADARKEAATATTEVKKVRKEAEAPYAAASKWHLAGYASTSFKATDLEDEDTTFIAGKFNPVFHYQYKDIIFFEGELEFEVEDDGGTGVELEYATLDLLAHDNATIVAGKFLSPLGQFQERLHPDWINKLPDRPAGFVGGALPLSDVGVMVRGGAAIDPVMINYSVFAGNGPQVELEDGTLEKIELEGFGEDANENKAIGGRVGILPVPYVEVGGSFMVSQVEGKKESGIAGPITEGDYTFWGADFAYTRGPFDLRFEYFNSNVDPFFSQAEADEPTELIDETDWEAWYVQLAYRLDGITDAAVLKNFEPVVRYGEFDIEGFDEFVEEGGPEDRFSVGLNYWFTPTATLKTSVSWRDFRGAGKENATEFISQFAYGF